MTKKFALVGAVATVALLAAGCGGGGGKQLASVGPLGIPKPEKDVVTVTHVSLPGGNRTYIVGLVENGSGEDVRDVVMGATVLDGTGTPVGQGRGQVVTPLTVAKDGVGLIRVDFDAPLPDPFTLEWELRKGDRVAGGVDLKVTSLDLQSSGRIEVVAKNDTGSRVKLTAVVVMCFDEAGNGIDFVLIPGAENRIPDGENVRVSGTATPGCVSAIAGAVGTNIIDPTTTSTISN